MQLPRNSCLIGPGHRLSHESPLVSMILKESCEEAGLPTLLARIALQAASRPEHHPPVRPYYEHRKEEQSKPELHIGRPSRHGQEKDAKQRDRADHGAHGGHYLGG